MVTRAQIGSTVAIRLDSESNTIPVSSAFMTGGWSTVSGPALGSLSSYAAYNSGTPGLVTFTAPSLSAWEAGAEPTSVSFTYKVNDGTTDSATATVLIYLEV